MKTGILSTDTSKQLLSPEEAAHALGISHWTVRGHVKRGAIASTRLGTLVKIPVEEIERIKTEGLNSLPFKPAAKSKAGIDR